MGSQQQYEDDGSQYAKQFGQNNIPKQSQLWAK
jgi:hypothetical protein